jgi:hypothetical protein
LREVALDRSGSGIARGQEDKQGSLWDQGYPEIERGSQGSLWIRNSQRLIEVALDSSGSGIARD